MHIASDLHDEVDIAACHGRDSDHLRCAIGGHYRGSRRRCLRRRVGKCAGTATRYWANDRSSRWRWRWRKLAPERLPVRLNRATYLKRHAGEGRDYVNLKSDLCRRAGQKARALIEWSNAVPPQ
jgi:hypothetical protein